MSLQPTVGCIVHDHSYGTPGGEHKPEPRAAIVTAVNTYDETSTVSLAVMNPTGMFFNEHVAYSDASKLGHWSWPPRN
ncbi:hypothetical protein ACFWHR_07440 [Leucobacter sp. NPDC058333]|uniref:hypothetical protein n=1 Tax=Leucobacter sp. NPDC058333 TaxID=3346450 RepID=UPI0036616091